MDDDDAARSLMPSAAFQTGGNHDQKGNNQNSHQQGLRLCGRLVTGLCMYSTYTVPAVYLNPEATTSEWCPLSTRTPSGVSLHTDEMVAVRSAFMHHDANPAENQPALQVLLPLV